MNKSEQKKLKQLFQKNEQQFIQLLGTVIFNAITNNLQDDSDAQTLFDGILGHEYPSKIIRGAFVWSVSNEGGDFWCRIHHLLVLAERRALCDEMESDFLEEIEREMNDRESEGELDDYDWD